MKKIIIQINSKEVLFQLKKFGQVELISDLFEIYSLEISHDVMDEIRKIKGIVSIEENKVFNLQPT